MTRFARASKVFSLLMLTCYLHGCTSVDSKMVIDKGYVIFASGNSMYVYNVETGLKMSFLKDQFEYIDNISRINENSFVAGLRSSDDGRYGARIKKYSFLDDSLITLRVGVHPVYIPERKIIFFYDREDYASDGDYFLFWAYMDKPGDAHKVEKVTNRKEAKEFNLRYLPSLQKFPSPIVQISDREIVYLDENFVINIYNYHTNKTIKVNGVRDFIPMFWESKTKRLYGQNYSLEGAISMLDLATMEVHPLQEELYIDGFYCKEHDVILHNKGRHKFLAGETYDMAGYSLKDGNRFLLISDIPSGFSYGYYQKEAPAGF